MAGFFPAAKLKQNYPECTHESGVVEKAGLSFGSALTGGGPLEGPLAWHPAGGEGSPGGGQPRMVWGPYLGSGSSRTNTYSALPPDPFAPWDPEAA